MTNPAPSPFAFVRTFNPVFTRDRHDGWKPAKQIAFINALAESGCVTDACRRVGMSTESAYALKRRYDAIDFRLTWDAALEYAVQRLSDAALSRAIHGVAVPHYYKGEVVGEHRRFNETLTMFILRYRDPVTYAKSWDRRDVVRGHPEAEAERLAMGIENIGLDNSRRICEENHAKEQAAADAEDEILMLNERREAAYQARIKAEDAAAARAAARLAAAEAAASARNMARPARPMDDSARDTARTDEGGAENALSGIGEGAFHSSVASGSSVFGAGGNTGDAPPDAPLDAGGDAFRSSVASGSSTSNPNNTLSAQPKAGLAIPLNTPAPTSPLPPAKISDEAASTAAGYRIVQADASPRGPGPPYWAQRIL